MGTQLTREDVMKALSEAIPAEYPARGVVLAAVSGMIPDLDEQKLLEDFDNPRVRKAFSQYKKYHPEPGNEEPDLASLMDWLLSKAGVTHAVELEKRMGEVRDIANSFGEIDPDEEYTISGTDILRLRVLTAAVVYSNDEERFPPSNE